MGVEQGYNRRTLSNGTSDVELQGDVKRKIKGVKNKTYVFVLDENSSNVSGDSQITKKT